MSIKNGLKGLVATAALVFASHAAQATEVLTYTGKAFTQSGIATGQSTTTSPSLNPSLGTSENFTLVLSVDPGYTGTLTYLGGNSAPWTSFTATAVGAFSFSGAVNPYGYWVNDVVTGSIDLVDGLPVSWDLHFSNLQNQDTLLSTNAYIPNLGFTAIGDESEVAAIVTGNGDDVTIPFNVNVDDPGLWSVAGVPEPGSWALMLTGVAGLGMALRLRRDRPATAG